jgi:hypothetical protein
MLPDKQFPTAFCRWTCPLCGMTRVGVRSDSSCNSASNNLRTHIRATADAAHGPQGAVPDAVDPDTLDEYVTCSE